MNEKAYHSILCPTYPQRPKMGGYWATNFAQILAPLARIFPKFPVPGTYLLRKRRFLFDFWHIYEVFQHKSCPTQKEVGQIIFTSGPFFPNPNHPRGGFYAGAKNWPAPIFPKKIQFTTMYTTILLSPPGNLSEIYRGYRKFVGGNCAPNSCTQAWYVCTKPPRGLIIEV